MGLSELTIKLLLIFVPGIICAYIVNSLIVQKPQKPFDFLMKSFILGLTSYFLWWLILTVLSLMFNVSNEIYIIKALKDTKNGFSFVEITFASGCAIVIGIGISVLSKYKVFNRISRKLGITNKFGELDVWGFMLNMKEVEWATIRDHKNDLIFDGWIQAFSDNSKEAEILLRDVSIYKNSTGERLYQAGLIYLSKDRNDISIECRSVEVDEKVAWKKEERADVQA